MVARPRNQQRMRTGIAIGATEVWAADVRLGASREGWHATIEPPTTDQASWLSLAEALRTLARTLGASGGELSIALLPPLTEVRRLELPPLRDDELRQLLARNAPRYFLGAREPQIVGTTGAAPRSSAGTVDGGVVGAAAAARLIGMIHDAARDAGWTVESIVPAEAGWRSGTVAMWPAMARGSTHLLVSHDDRTDLVTMHDGRITGVRRFRAGAADADLIAEAVSQSSNGTAPKVAAMGMVAQRKELTHALAGRTPAVAVPPEAWARAAAAPGLAAATFVAAGDPFALRTDDARAIRAARGRRAALGVAGIAAGLLVLAAGFEWWGTQRELNAIRAQRRDIAPQVAQVLAGRTSMDAAAQRLAGLSAAERASPQWSVVMATLSQNLDAGAHLLSLRARGDTLVVEGLARSAARAFDSIERIPSLTAVRAAAPVRRETQDDGTALERFTIQARVVPAGGAR